MKAIISSFLFLLTFNLHGQVNRIDHFVINTPNSASLIKLLSDELGLPISWQSGENAGISLGNITMECSNYASSEYTLGIGLEPVQPADEFISSLDAAGVSHGELDPHYGQSEDGTEFLMYTLIDLHKMLPEPAVYTFIVDYNSRDYMQNLQAQAAGQLKNSDGGALGVKQVRELIIATSNYEAYLNQISKLPGVERPEENLYTFPEGPSIRLINTNDEDHFEVVIQVTSLEDAAEQLTARSIVHKKSEHQLEISDQFPDTLSLILTE